MDDVEIFLIREENSHGRYKNWRYESGSEKLSA